MRFIENYPIDQITPADYNPRKIKENAFEKLQESLLKFGVCKAVIANLDGTIVAGHQRTKAMKAVGINHCPIFILEKNVSLQDEIKFNLMHNSVETEMAKMRIDNAADIPFGFTLVKNEHLETVHKGKGSIIKEISRLISKYGDYGNIIVDEDGNVIHNADYAYCCKLLGNDVVVYKMHNEHVREFLMYLGIDYGEYNYETLGIKPYVQTHCQMSRNGSSIKSTLYENFVIPSLTKSDRLVDFGAGKCFYSKNLRQKGYDTHWYEPFYKTEGTEKLNVSEVVRMIKALNRDIKEKGLYNVVVLDSVINSITSNDYEDWVLTCCNALMSQDGTFFTGTRNLQVVQDRGNLETSSDSVRYIEFLDKDNFSATFRKGTWTMQKFHDKESLTRTLKRYFEDVQVVDKGATQIWAVCRKPKDLGKERYEKALNIEFNLEYPGGYRHNQHERLVETILSYH